jgi:hypothetical protein
MLLDLEDPLGVNNINTRLRRYQFLGIVLLKSLELLLHGCLIGVRIIGRINSSMSQTGSQPGNRTIGTFLRMVDTAMATSA